MAAPALNHRIPPRRFLTPPPNPPVAAVTMAVLESQRRFHRPLPSLLSIHNDRPCFTQKFNFHVASCLDSSSPSSSTPRTRLNPSTRLYVSGLSFRTTEESLRNAFKNFGELIEVKLVMDRIANRPRGFAFLKYKTEEESKKAVEGMHGKFLDGRVIFVEVAKSRAELGQETKQQNPRQR